MSRAKQLFESAVSRSVGAPKYLHGDGGYRHIASGAIEPG